MIFKLYYGTPKIVGVCCNYSVKFNFVMLEMNQSECRALHDNLLFPMFQRSKWCLITGFPSSLHFLGHSSLVHLAIDVWRSEMNDFITIVVPNRNVKAFWKARNSIPYSNNYLTCHVANGGYNNLFIIIPLTLFQYLLSD